MQHVDPLAHLASKPVGRLKVLLATTPGDGDHGPASFDCETCRGRWIAALKTLQTPDIDTKKLRSIAAPWADGHQVGETCGRCEGCRAELDAAARTAVLCDSRIDHLIILGPTHRGDEAGRRCKPCRVWVDLRHRAHDLLLGSGYDPRRWLPPVDLATHHR